MKRILVLGRKGMLGHMVFKILSQDPSLEIQGTQAENPEASDYFNTESEFSGFNNYDYIINCIGVLDGAADIEAMIKVNALFPHKLAASIKGKIIHMSTDGVFSGKAEQYNEDAPHDCLDAYGKTKSLGEVIANNVLNIRTSIIGPSPHKKAGLLEWFLSQPDSATVNGYTNHIWNGVTTLQYAELCAKIIKENIFDKFRAESPVFHFASNQPITKYELLNLFKKTFNKNVKIDPIEDLKGPVRRILTSKFSGLKQLFQQNIKMEEAVTQLKNI